MLKALQKAMGVKPEATTETLIEAAVAELRGEFDEFKQTAEALLQAAEEEKASLVAQLEAANALVAEYRTATEQAVADAAAAEAAALKAKLDARKEKLVAAVGTERADALMAVEMDDAAFEAVVSALGVNAAAEAASPLFTEVGVDAEADAAQVVESAEMRILKEKYGQK